MNVRSLAGVAALALLLSACSAMTDSPEAAPEPSSDIVLTSGAGATQAAAGARNIKPRRAFKGAKKARKINLRLLPQIAQPGKKKAAAGRARTPLVVQVQPRRRTVVTIQVRAGNRWRVLRHASTNNNGHAVLRVPPRRNGNPARYRIKVGNTFSPVRNTKRWLRPTLNHNFNGNQLPRMWSHRLTGFYNPSGHRECSRAMPRAVRVAGGQVRLSVMRDGARNGRCTAKRDGRPLGQHAYRVNGHISTEGRFDFQYGFAAARIRFPVKRGQHGAFWLQPTAPDFSRPFRPGNAGAEIDIVESFGRGAGTPRSLGLSSFTYHHQRADRSRHVKKGGWTNNAQQYMANRNAKPWNTYHVYSVEWTPKRYIFRIDGKVTRRINVGISNTPQFLILSLLSSDYQLPNLGGDHRLPAHMHVDWVRVWETGR